METKATKPTEETTPPEDPLCNDRFIWYDDPNLDDSFPDDVTDTTSSDYMG